MNDDGRRRLPSVDRVLEAMRKANGELPHDLAADAVRDALQAARAGLEGHAGAHGMPGVDLLAEDALQRVHAVTRPSLRRVVNATGVLLQTNLGRAPLSDAALAAMSAVGGGYSNLEFDLEAGGRGSRHEHVRTLIARATGAEDGIVVNNNAAALFFVLHVFASGKGVVVSRGQAVEIGGGFRIPAVLAQSGARLMEVGTTNRTYARDYAAAIDGDTAALLRVHASNFALQGFVHEASAAEMAGVARESGVLLIDDLGSGCLLDTRQWGMAAEPTVQASLAAGADLALFSGDKLLGGPQCGIIAGRSDLVEQLRRHPLARALRVDKTAIAALNATLLSYVRGTATEDIPLWQMVSAPGDAVRRRARRWARAAGDGAAVVAAATMVGGGSLPGQGIASWAVALRVEHVDALSAKLRALDVPIVGRIEGGALLLDPRGVAPADDRYVENALRRTVETKHNRDLPV